MGIIADAFEDTVVRHGLSFAEQAVLTRLLLLVDHRDATYRCTLGALADRVGLHRHNLRPKLDRLQEVGLIEHWFPRGHAGEVTVVAYGDLVHLTTAQRADHAERNARITPYVTRGFLPSDHESAPDPQRANHAEPGPESRGATCGFTTSMSVGVVASGEETARPDVALPDVPGIVVELCNALADSIAADGSKRPTVSKAWLTDMDRLIRLDHRDPDEIARVIRWLAAGRDEIAAFWQPNILSPKKLRARWDQMRKQHNSRGSCGTRQQQTAQAWDDSQAIHDIANGQIDPNTNPLDSITRSTR